MTQEWSGGAMNALESFPCRRSKREFLASEECSQGGRLQEATGVAWNPSSPEAEAKTL